MNPRESTRADRDGRTPHALSSIFGVLVAAILGAVALMVRGQRANAMRDDLFTDAPTAARAIAR